MQIHSGPVHRIEVVGPWLNVLDPRFNLHLRQDLVASAAVVRKPSVHGDIHALELFDAAGEIAVQFFGTRPPQGQERADWRALVTGCRPRLERERRQRFTAIRDVWNAYGMRMESVLRPKQSGFNR